MSVKRWLRQNIHDVFLEWPLIVALTVTVAKQGLGLCSTATTNKHFDSLLINRLLK